MVCVGDWQIQIIFTQRNQYCINFCVCITPSVCIFSGVTLLFLPSRASEKEHFENVSRGMLWNEWFFFDVFINYLPKIHRSVLHKIAIDLLYFWDVYDVSLWEKNYNRSTVYKTEAVFPITYFKAKAVIGRHFSKIVVMQCSFFAFVNPEEMPLTDLI